MERKGRCETMGHRIKNGAQVYNELRTWRKTDAFEEWGAYRQELTQFLLANCEKGQHLAIMGAGHCNDVDLRKLAEHFSEITLIDFDDAAMTRAGKQQGVEHEARIHPLAVDFVGLKAADYIHYADVVLRALENRVTIEPWFQILEELNSMYEKISSYQVDLGQDVYDCSLVLGVHSQLNDMASWIWSRCQTKGIQRVDESQDPVGSRINDETPAIVRRFNDAVCQATKETLITGHETGIVGSCQSIQGAAQAERDLKIRESSGQLALTKTHVTQWPYDLADHLVFTMLLQVFQVLK